MAEQRDPIQQKIDRWRKHRVTKDMVMDILAPNSYNEGLTVENVFRDAAPTVADYLDWADGKDIPPEELAWDLALSFPGLPMAARAGKKFMKFAKKAGKGGFIVKPEFPFKNERQKEATERLANAWTNEVRDRLKKEAPARPQDPRPVTYASKKANDITDSQFRYPITIAKSYKDPAGKLVTESEAQLGAILPENAPEAAYVRHQKTSYDDKLKNIRHAMESDRAIRQSFRRVPTLRGYEDQLPTVDGTYVNRTDRAKNKVFDDIEAQMPGYREAAKIPDPRYMQERGLNVATIFDSNIDKQISRQQADIDFWNTLINDERFMKSTPDPDQVYKNLEASRKKLIDLQNMKTEQTLDVLD